MTSCRFGEMADVYMSMIREQTYEAKHVNLLRHAIVLPPAGTTGGSKADRASCLRTALESSTADFFMLADDDDYIGPHYVERCVEGIGDRPLFGHLPRRYYHLRLGRWAVNERPRRLFQTFTLYARELRDEVARRITAGGLSDLLTEHMPHPTHVDDLVVMRGAMRNPERAITRRKNVSSAYWPNADDAGRSKLREWIGDEAAQRYLALL